MAALIALNEVSIAFSLLSFQRDDKWIHIFLAILAAGIAMLGPGAWSIDARLFGRRRVDIRSHYPNGLEAGSIEGANRDPLGDDPGPAKRQNRDSL